MARFATKYEVLKHYRMLTSGEAFIRQVMLSFGVSSVLTVFYFISSPISGILTTGAAAYVIYDVIELFYPSIEFKKETIDTLLEQPNAAAAVITPAKSKKKVNPKGKPVKPNAENKDTLEKDVPPHAHTFPDDRSILVKILTSQQAVAAIKLVVSVAAAYVLALLILSLSWKYACSVLVLLYMEAGYSLTSTTLRWIEAHELDEYPSKLKEKLMFNFLSKFAEARGFFFIGEYAGKRIGLRRRDRFTHYLIAGPTGTRKTSSSIDSALLIDAGSVGSAIFPDRKSPSRWNTVAGRWLAKGKKAFLFDPWNSNCIGINLLHRAEDEDLLDIVEVFLHEKEEVLEKKDSFFKSRTKYLFYSLLKLVQSFKDEYANLPTVFKCVESVETLEHFATAAVGDLRPLFSDYLKMNGQEKFNALTAIRERLEIFMDANVRKAFSKPEFNFNLLFQENDPCLLVIGAPMNHKDTGSKMASILINLIVSKAFEERTQYLDEVEKGEKSAAPNDLYLYLDELRSLAVTDLATLVSIARESRIQVIACVTDIGFFKYYRESFSSLMGGLRNQVYMRGLDLDSCKYIAESLGKQKVPDLKWLRGLTVGGKDEYLKDVSDIHNLPDEEMIVSPLHTRPFIAKKVSMYTTSWLKKMKISAPPDMRKLYQEWKFATGPLVDPVLPKEKGLYNLAAIKSEKSVKVDPNIAVETFHKETGNGKYRKPRVRQYFDHFAESTDTADTTLEEGASVGY